MIVKKDKMFTRKPLIFIFLNKRVKIVPKYSGTADISKTVSGLLIEEKLWSWEQKFGFLAARAARSDMPRGNRHNIIGNELSQIIFHSPLDNDPSFP